MAMLEVNDLNVYYGNIHAIKGVSFEVNEGEIISLIGANGAGKTTIMHAINALIPKSGGTVTLAGDDITGIQAHKLVSRGLAQPMVSTISRAAAKTAASATRRSRSTL